MRRLLFAAAMSLTVPLGAAPASGGEPPPGVVLTDERVVVPLDEGYYVAVLCNATADPGVFEDIPLGTVVACSVNGVTRRQGMPGREAFAVVNGTFSAPIEICISGEAAFLDLKTGAFVFASAGPRCETVSPGQILSPSPPAGS